jgi:Tfp pilus assembly protein PilF
MALFAAGTAFAEQLPINQLPMYGGGAKSDAMKKADEALISSIEKRGISRKEAAKSSIRLAWGYWQKQDVATAMSRFNQAWMLDPENGNSYYGFALVTAVRGGQPSEIERFFKLAISKP